MFTLRVLSLVHPTQILLYTEEKEEHSLWERFRDYFDDIFTSEHVVFRDDGIFYNFTLDAAKWNKDIFVVDSNLDPWTFKAKGATFEWEGPWEGEWDTYKGKYISQSISLSQHSWLLWYIPSDRQSISSLTSLFPFFKCL